MEYCELDESMRESKPRSVDRAVVFLWLAKRVKGVEGLSAKELAKIIEHDCGHPAQNVSRLDDQLMRDKRTARHGKEAFRLKPDASRVIEESYGHLLDAPRPGIRNRAGSIIPIEIFQRVGREYLTRIVDQINGCYDNGFYDGVMVLSRRLLETLVIEIYQQAGRSNEVKHPNAGTYFGFEDLIGALSADAALHVTRDSKRTLVAVKKYGDQSAHNPRFTARKSDVDELKQGLRIAAEELLSLCHYNPTQP